MRATEPTMIDAVAEEAMTLLAAGRQVAPFSARYPGFGLAEAYAVTARVRDARKERNGEVSAGRKIGFTNTAIWESYGISGPIWGYLYDTTVHDLDPAGGSACSLAGLPEPRIEPELALHLSRAPEPGMTEAELADCIDWVAPAFEVVFSIFPGWKFAAADAVAAYGVHAGLYLGRRLPLGGSPEANARLLAAFDVEMRSNGGVARRGHARNVLGSPLRSLGFLVTELQRFPDSDPLRAGEIVTTGTLTEAMPLAPGEVWSATFGLDVPSITLRFA